MARTESMAAIDAALTAAPLMPAQKTATTQSVVAPHAAPGVNAPTPITGNEKKPVANKEKSDDDIVAENEKAAQQELAEQQRQQDLFKRSANATVDAAGRIVKNTSVTLERIPTPGSIALPLIILAVFFFLLLPINGHTRFVWIWLALTGNANIGRGNTNSTPEASSEEAPLGIGPSGAPGLASSLPNFSFSYPMMTGVEDL